MLVSSENTLFEITKKEHSTHYYYYVNYFLYTLNSEIQLW